MATWTSISICLLTPGSNSGIYLQSRYEVQLFDSWGVKDRSPPTAAVFISAGTPHAAAGKEGYEGTAPKANACRAPASAAPAHRISRRRFDDTGKKTKTPRFAKGRGSTAT